MIEVPPNHLNNQGLQTLSLKQKRTQFVPRYLPNLPRYLRYLRYLGRYLLDKNGILNMDWTGALQCDVTRLASYDMPVVHIELPDVRQRCSTTSAVRHFADLRKAVLMVLIRWS